MLEEENPKATDLTKTQTFKEWEQQQLKKGNDSDDESNEATIKLNTYYIKDPEADETITTFTAAIQETIQIEKAPETPTSTATVQETERNNAEFERVDDIVNEIISELEHEQGIRELFNVLENNEREEQNEGIELNHEDEGIGLNLEDVIGYEPFDFEQEVDFDF